MHDEVVFSGWWVLAMRTQDQAHYGCSPLETCTWGGARASMEIGDPSPLRIFKVGGGGGVR